MQNRSTYDGTVQNKIERIFLDASSEFANGKFMSAYAFLIQAYKIDPRNLQVLYLLSETCLRLGAIGQADRYANDALNENSQFKAALAPQIEVSVRQNNIGRARELLRGYPETNEFSLSHALLEKRIELAEGRYEAALTELAGLIETAGHSPNARELFSIGFKDFLELGDKRRINEFLDSMGLLLPEGVAEQNYIAAKPPERSIDVIIPVYNSVDELSDCLRSLKEWSEPSLNKIIIVDDASNIQTKLWIDSYVEQHSDIILLRNSKNQGFTLAVIAGISQSTAPFFTLLNSDTIVTPGWMSGLWRGLTADDCNAMAGPLSSSAYFQSICNFDTCAEIEGLVGNQKIRAIEKLAALIRGNGNARYPKVPLLSGFCLMFRRIHYDMVGGLDGKLYPRGYGEVQDIALRLIEFGLSPCIVDDVYVHHKQSGSIDTDRRNVLIVEGFMNLFTIHGAIRVLSAEEICRNSEAVERQRQTVISQFSVANLQSRPNPKNSQISDLEIFNQGEIQNLDMVLSHLQTAHSVEPAVVPRLDMALLMPPYHDHEYRIFKKALSLLPECTIDTVVLIPFCMLGGADYVAGLLARNLTELGGRTLVIQTDRNSWDRPDWFKDVFRLNLCEISEGLSDEKATRLLYELLRAIHPGNIFNVNSRMGFETYIRFGKQLKTFTRLHSYFFCSDRTSEGQEVGYPVEYFSKIFDNLSTAITDSAYLAKILKKRFMLTGNLESRVQVFYTPSRFSTRGDFLVDNQVANATKRKRGKIIWAGRFDRQKRFDILLSVADKLPEVDFLVWGKAVLDSPPDFDNLPANVALHAPFVDYNDLPLEDVDGFFYTSDWDGVPTILIDLGALGMPMVVSAAGGVPELINGSTGWSVHVGSTSEEYALIIKDMLADPNERKARAKALAKHVMTQHGKENFNMKLKSIVERSS